MGARINEPRYLEKRLGLDVETSIIKRRLEFAEQSKGGAIVRYLVVRDFTASGSTD